MAVNISKYGATQDAYKLKTHKCKVTIYEKIAFEFLVIRKLLLGFEQGAKQNHLHNTSSYSLNGYLTQAHNHVIAMQKLHCVQVNFKSN